MDIDMYANTNNRYKYNKNDTDTNFANRWDHCK